MDIKTNILEIYTDGSCFGNPGPGGWAYIILKNDKIIEENSGKSKNTTNNIMELEAVICSLRNLEIYDYKKIIIYSDSTYVINGITKWIHTWKINGWKTSNKNPVKNTLLWMELYNLSKNLFIEWKHVKAHNGNHYNELVDKKAKHIINNIY